jgi:hypothetical protein
MSDANIYREKARLLDEAANAAADEQVRVILLRLAGSALQTARKIEALHCGWNPIARTESDKEY